MPGVPRVKPSSGQIKVAKKRISALLQGVNEDISHLPTPVVRQLNQVLGIAEKETAQALQRWLLTVEDGAERFTAHHYRQILLQLRRGTAVAGQKIGQRPAWVETLQGRTFGSLNDMSTRAGHLATQHLIDELMTFDHAFGTSVAGGINIKPASIILAGKKTLVPRFRNSAARYAGAVWEDMKTQLAVGMVKQETIHQMTERLVKMGGPKGMVALKGMVGDPAAVVEHIPEGLFKRYRYWAERVARTESINAYNQQAQEGLEQAEAIDDEMMKRWDASLDSRVCTICAPLHDEVVEVKGLFSNGEDGPPAHPNCRCARTAWHKSWADDLKGVKSRTEEMDAKHYGGPSMAAQKAIARKNKEAPPAPKGAPVTPKPPPVKTSGGTIASVGTKKREKEGARAVSPEMKFAKAWEEGDLNKARAELTPSVSKTFGMTPQKRPVKTMKVTKDMNALGSHDWNGLIELHPDQRKRATKFLAEWKKNPAKAKKAMDEVQALTEQYQEKNRKIGALTNKWQKGRLKKTIPKEKLAAMKAELDVMNSDRMALMQQIREHPGTKLIQNSSGVHTVAHEILHGFGSLDEMSYFQIGIPAEEIATEVLARRFMRLRFGIPWEASHAENSYGKYIAPMIGKIRKLYGVNRKAAFDILEKASLRYKRIKKVIDDGHETAETFTRCFPKVGKAELDAVNENIRNWWNPLTGEYDPPTKAQYALKEAMGKKAPKR